MESTSYKYRIIAWLAEITPKSRQIEARKRIVLLIGLSDRSFKRKLYSKLSQKEAKYQFKPGHLEIIAQVLNEYRGHGLPHVEVRDLLNPGLKQVA